MENPTLNLCRFCLSAAARPGDTYCCEGCRTLDGVHRDETPAPDISPRDLEMTRHFGESRKGGVSFECHVDALSCEACLQGLSRLEERIPGLRDLRWDRQRSVLSFAFPEGQSRPSMVGQILDHLHMNPRWLRSDQKVPSSERTRLLRLGLTAGLAANIMLFAAPVYTGVTGELRTIFEWIQFVLFLPVFFWSARPIFRTAWVSLKLHQISVDLPLAIAFILGSVFSTLSLMRGGHDIYFDSLAGFLILILWSRSLLDRSLSQALTTPDVSHFFDKPLFEIVRKDETTTVPWDRLEIDDVLILRAGDRVPADGTLLSQAAEIETAWMTGERHPRLRLKGSLLQAGVRLLSPEARIRVTGHPHETEFASLVRTLRHRGDKLGGNLEGHLGAALVILCLAVTAGMFLFASHLGFAEILRRSLALLIIACPCAVSFAAPLARARANRIAHRLGFWVRDPRVWDRLVGVRHIAFDKTGTLTGGLLVPSPRSPMIDDQWKRIILSLENISRHPVAESLRRIWGRLDLYPVSDAREIPGSGVEGRIEGVLYQVRGSKTTAQRASIDLIREGTKILELELQDDVHPQTQELLSSLRSKYKISLISGDREDRVHAFGLTHGFQPEMMRGGLDPQGKVRALAELQPDVYIGDGTNDLPALQKVPVSVAVSAAALEAQAAADLVMFDGDLRKLEDLITLARETRKLNHRNLAFALIYNFMAGTAAVLGLIHPLAAAILMPLSSLALLGSTLWGTVRLRLLERSR